MCSINEKAKENNNNNKKTLKIKDQPSYEIPEIPQCYL